jgi:hypothetical protein
MGKDKNTPASLSYPGTWFRASSLFCGTHLLWIFAMCLWKQSCTRLNSLIQVSNYFFNCFDGSRKLRIGCCEYNWVFVSWKGSVFAHWWLQYCHWIERMSRLPNRLQSHQSRLPLFYFILFWTGEILHSHTLCTEIPWTPGLNPGWPSARLVLLTKRALARSQGYRYLIEHMLQARLGFAILQFHQSREPQPNYWTNSRRNNPPRQ